MSQADVELLFGGPPGNYGNPELNDRLQTLEGVTAPPGSIEKLWFDDYNQFELYFNPSGRLVGWHKRFSFSRFYRPPEWRRKISEWIRR